MKRNRTDTFQVASEKNVVWFGRAIIFSCAAILLLRLISSYFPKERLWGLNHLAYFSPYFAIVITVLGLLVLVPKINHWLQSILKRLLNFIYELTIKRHKYLYFMIFSFLSIIVFWSLRVKTPLLGDGYHLTAGRLAEKAIETTELLERATRFYLYKFLKQFLSVDMAATYALVSYLAGAIFVFFAILTGDLLGKNRFEKVFVFSILISMGSILLFLGYVENYSLTCATILAYLYFSLRYLKNRSSILPATLIFILGCFLHLLTFCLLPSLVFLYLLRSDFHTQKLYISKKRIFLFSLISILIVIGICMYIMGYGKYSSLLEIIIPLSPAWYNVPYYTLFSLSQLLDIFNEHLLVSPIGLILLLAIVVIFGLKKIELRDRTFQFLVIVMLFQLAFPFLIDPDLGVVRDWDLFSFTALGYTLLGIYLFLKLVQDERRIRYIGTVLVFTSFLSTLPWVIVNANTKKSLKRIVNAVELDPARNFSLFLYIDEYLEKMGRLGAEERKKMDELYRQHFGLAWLNMKGWEQVKAGNPERAEHIFKEAVRIAPGRASTHHNLGIFYKREGKLDEAIFELEKVIQLDPEDILAFRSYAGLGDIYSRKRQYEKAAEMYKGAIKGKINNKEMVYHKLGQCYLLTGKLDEAISMHRETLKLNHNFVEPHLYLGHAYRKKGMKDKAIEEYRIYLKYATDDKEIEKIQTLISKLNQQ